MSQRNMNKTMSKRRGKTKDDKNKNQFDKRKKDNKTISQKRKRKGAGKKTLTEDNKKRRNRRSRFRHMNWTLMCILFSFKGRRSVLATTIFSHTINNGKVNLAFHCTNDIHQQEFI
jgi:hypothetical protein